MLIASYSGLGAVVVELDPSEAQRTGNPCDAFTNATTRDACKLALAAKGPNAIAQFLAASGGAAACTAVGGAAIAPLCSAAASAVYNWIVAGYTSKERADILWRAANGQAGAVMQMGVYGSLSPAPEAYKVTATRDAVRANIKLLAIGDAWARPKNEGVDLILLGMILKGVVGKPINWWIRKRQTSDLSPLAPTTPTSGSPPKVGALVRPPIPVPGAITAWSAKRNAWRVAMPRGLGQSEFDPLPGLLTQVQTADESNTRRALPWLLGGVAAVIAIGGGVALATRRKRRR